jgi:hypothetical protein
LAEKLNLPMELNYFDAKASSLRVGQKPRHTGDYRSITTDNQQGILLRRRRKAIAVFERDMLATFESSQRQAAKRFLNNLKRSETLLKEHESTKRTLFARHSQNSSGCPGIEGVRNKSRSLSFSESTSTETSKTPECNKVDQNRAFSGKLKERNDRIDVPYIKLSSYTKEDLKRPSTSLELKRKAWEKVSKHLDEARSLRPCSADFIAKCEGSVPRNVRDARKKLRELTKVRLLSQLPPAPPRIDVHKVQEERRVSERIEKQIVGEFCQSLDELKVVLPRTSCWMDVNEIYLKNAEVQKRHGVESRRNDLKAWQHLPSGKKETVQADIKTRRRRKGQ